MKASLMSRMHKRAVLSVLFALLASLLQVAQPQMFIPTANAAEVDTSTEGFAFDISLAPSRGEAGTTWRLYLSPSETGTATIDWPSSSNSTVSLTAGTVANITVAEADRVALGASGVQSKNISITSTSKISVYGCWVQSAASDCTIFYPTGTWGTEYRPLYTAASVGAQIISIVTAGSSANVSLTSPRDITASPSNFTAGTPLNISIAANSSYIFRTTLGEFSGTVITSDVPVSVLNGAECINFEAQFPGVGGACDLAAQSVPPVSAWGTNYYSVNYRNQGTTGSGYRILADQDDTTVTISGDTTGLSTTSYTLNAGEIATFRAFTNTGSTPHLSLAFSSNKPILIGHYMFNGLYSGLSGSTSGDPSMSYLTPFEQFLNSYTFASPPDLAIANLNIVAPVDAVGTISLDGTTIASSEFRQIAGSTWRSAQLVISTGTHTISAPQAFGIEVFGAGSFDSYAYTGGSNTSPIANVASLQLSSPNINGVVGQSACVPVQVLDASGSPVLGVRVDATISGVSGSSSTSATSDSNGIANFCVTGTVTGVDNFSFASNGFTASGSITWSLPAPDISYTPNSLQLATSDAMRSLNPTNVGGLASTWSISPSLPSGLSFSTSTGEITGTPASDFSSAPFTVTATNASGSDTAIINLSSAAAVRASILYSPSTVSLTLDVFSEQIPTVSGTFPTWSISPSLPTGLSINPQNGVVFGTPTRISSLTAYTVTATNSAGSETTVLNLAVIPTLPNISHSPTSYALTSGVASSAIAPRNTGSPATSWSISPSLPAGLAFNPTNGNITGTPTVSSALTSYTITATNSAGSSTSTISISISGTSGGSVTPTAVAQLAYRIDWGTNTGTGYMNPQYAYANSSIVLERNLYKKDGYTFAGWNTKADGSGVAYADGASFKIDSTDVILYAQWKLIQTKPTITWSTPIAIQEGTALSATQLNALAGVAGSYTYIPASTTMLPVGKHTLKVIFVPTEAKYETVETTVEIEVLATAKITWANPAAIVEGTALSATQLNALGSVPGTYSYAPAAGTQLPVGMNTLKVTFTPTDTRLSAVTAEVTIDVTAVIPTAPISPIYTVTGNQKSTITWGAGTNAATYTVSVDGKSACSVAVLTCEVAKLLGPKSVVTVTSVAAAGRTSAAVPANYVVPNSPQVLTVVNFDSARAVLKKTETAKLRAFASQIKAAGFTSLTVFGHTDSVGGVDNKKLSVSRANSTISYLKKLLPGVKFVVSGFASGEPVADNSTAEGKAANRRAEVFIP